MARLLLFICLAATPAFAAASQAQAYKGQPRAATSALHQRTAHRATLGAQVPADPAELAASLAERYWGATPCGGQIAIQAAQSLPAGMQADTDGWVTFESSLGIDDLQAPAETYAGCTISLARWQWPTNARMADDWNMFCLTVVHEMGHLLGHAHSLTPHSVMAPVFVDESSVPEICRAARTQVEATFG